MKLLTHSQTSKVLTTCNHAGGSCIFVRASTRNIIIIPSFRFFVVSCMLSTYHVSSRIVISIYSILIPMNKHKWKICSLWSKPGMGLLSQLPSFRYFQFFSIVMTHLSYAYVYIWKVSSKLSCSDALQIWMWLKNQILAKSYNIWGPDMISRGPNIINRGPNIIISAPT